MKCANYNYSGPKMTCSCCLFCDNNSSKPKDVQFNVCLKQHAYINSAHWIVSKAELFLGCMPGCADPYCNASALVFPVASLQQGSN